MSNDAKGRADQTPPTDPPPPIPPVSLNSPWDIVKIIVFVVIWYMSTDANKALVAAVDYSKLTSGVGQEIISLLPGLTLLGAKIGLLQGLVISAQALVTIWAGPTVFTYLGPVLTAAFKTPINLVSDFRRAWTLRSRENKDDGTEEAGSMTPPYRE